MIQWLASHSKHRLHWWEGRIGPRAIHLHDQALHDLTTRVRRLGGDPQCSGVVTGLVLALTLLPPNLGGSRQVLIAAELLSESLLAEETRERFTELAMSNEPWFVNLRRGDI